MDERNNNLTQEVEPVIDVPTIVSTPDATTIDIQPEIEVIPEVPTIDVQPEIEMMPVAPMIEEVPVVEMPIEVPTIEEPIAEIEAVSPSIDFGLDFEDQINRATAPQVQVMPIAPMIEEVTPASPVQILMPEEENNETPAPPQIGSAGYAIEETPEQPIEASVPVPRFQPVAEENKNGKVFIAFIVIVLTAFIIFLPQIRDMVKAIFG